MFHARAVQRREGGVQKLHSPLTDWSARTSACALSLRGRLEVVFDDLAIERPAADLQDSRRFLLVPSGHLERAADVGLLGLTQGRKTRRRKRIGPRMRVQEINVGVANHAARC